MKIGLLPVAAIILEWQGRAVQSALLLSPARAHPQYIKAWTDRWARFTTLQTRLRAELGAEK